MSVQNWDALHPKTEFCPHLGIHEDTQTCLAYATEWNLCYRARPASPVSLPHQRKVCLSPVYTGCPVFLSARAAPLPRHMRAAQARSRWFWVWLAFFFVLAGLGLWWAWGSQPGRAMPLLFPPGDASLKVSAPLASATALRPAAFTRTPFPATFSPPAPKPSATPTPTAVKHCGYALEAPILWNGRTLILHKVRRGESIESLTGNYETSLPALQAVNYFLPSPLWAELVIVIPAGDLAGEGLPVIEPYQVQDPSISIQDLARLVSVTADELIATSALDADCQGVSGWVLVPRQGPKNQ